MDEYPIMTEQPPTTPDDPVQLQALLEAAWARIADLEHQLEQLAATAEERERAIACLKEEHLALQRLLFGPRRERLPEDPGQQHLFELGAPPAAPEVPAEPAALAPRKKRKGHGRRPIPENLPRQEIVHDVPLADQTCGCGRARTKIGEDITEQLDYEPGKLVVLRHHYPKYACSSCKDGVTSAQAVANPIDRGLAGPGLIANVVVDKFGDHLPLYRQQDGVARLGMFFARSTLCGWIAQSADLFGPLAELMHQRILGSHVIQADDTTVRVLDRTRQQTRQSYFYAFVGDAANQYTVYDYRDSHEAKGPIEFLGDFSGYLQTDAHSNYEKVVNDSGGRIIPVGCWAHARRNFYDARFNKPREAHYVLGLVAQLYDIEDEIRLLGPEERLATRQQKSVPVLDRLGVFLREQQGGELLPKSKYAQAVGYALNHWKELRRFTEDGRLEIDNNLSERTLRPCAIGRKNWLFVGSDKGGESAATCMTILAGAKRHRIEPFAYVRGVLIGLSSGAVPLESLLPDAWIAAHPEHFQEHRREESESAAAARRRRRAARREMRLGGRSP